MTFQERLIAACDDNPLVPMKGDGRYTYIANHTKIGEATVARWFRGECEPRHSKMALLAELLKVDLNWLSLGDPEFKDVQKLLRLSSADVFAFAAYLVEQGCSVGTDANNASTLTAVCHGHVFHFQLVAGRVNNLNQVELDQSYSVREKDTIAVASIRRKGSTAVAEVRYQFIDLADVSIADGILWSDESETFQSNGVNLLPLLL